MNLKKTLFSLLLSVLPSLAFGVLAGGRPNAISGGINAFAGVVNPANSVWIVDRFDVGAFLVFQRSSFHNREDNPLFAPGKTDLTYHAKTLFTADFAINKHVKWHGYDSAFTFAYYTTPSFSKLRTKMALPSVGTTPIFFEDKVQVFSFVFSFKLNKCHSIGASADYFYLSHQRNGFQNSDNPLRSVSPGHVTNNGMDHSGGLGLSLGWRWNITESLTFGAAFVKKSYVGQYRKYRGYEPEHANNYIPETVGAGFTYRFTKKLAGRLEVLWSNLGNLPGANNNILPNGDLNRNKRGSNKSPGPGLQDATYINLGFGFIVNKSLGLGAGLSHRIKLSQSSNILSHSYASQTIYDIIAVGANYKYKKHDFFISLTAGLKNLRSGHLPEELGGGKFAFQKSNNSISMAYGYLF